MGRQWQRVEQRDRNCDTAHTCRFRSAHAVRRVFQHDAGFWRHIEAGGSAQEQIRSGFDPQPIAPGAHAMETVSYSVMFEPSLDPLARRA
jgi:hypothetical protein